MKADCIITFSNEHIGEIKGVKIRDKLWFLTGTVCNCLKLSSAKDTVRKLRERHRQFGDRTYNDLIRELTVEDDDGNKRRVSIISEQALYELIFLSKTKKAFEFQQWVFSGVLPSFEKMSGIKTLRQISLKPNRDTLRKPLVPHAKLNYTQMICKSLGLPFDVDKNKLPDDILANFAYRQNIVNNMLLEGRQYWEIQNFLLGDKK